MKKKFNSLPFLPILFLCISCGTSEEKNSDTAENENWESQGAECSPENKEELVTMLNACFAESSTGDCPIYAEDSDCGSVGTWDTSNITDMSGLFQQKVDFNQDISGWNTSHVVNMSSMFSSSDDAGSHSFNQDISCWDLSNVSVSDGFGTCEITIEWPNIQEIDCIENGLCTECSEEGICTELACDEGYIPNMDNSACEPID